MTQSRSHWQYHLAGEIGAFVHWERSRGDGFSIAAEERCVYTHTGWRKVNGQWLFLHAGGAIGNVGTVSEVNVRLLGSMSRYEMAARAYSRWLGNVIAPEPI